MAEPQPGSSGRLGKHQPFPGLSPFDVSESAWFFGRGRETFDVLNRLREIHFIAVVGPSGCGKSSLIKAGVLATLQRGYVGADWRIVSTRPADGPMNNLIREVQAALPGVENIGSNLRAGALGLVGVVREAKLPPDAKLLVLVDQFEELFQFVRRAEERSESARRRGDATAAELAQGVKAVEEAKAFLKLLLTAALSDAAPIYVVITMRSEWLGHCASYRGLAEAINEGLYLVPDMTRPELRKAIVQPILQADGEIVSPLVDRLLNDLDDRTDQLPVLQHALMLMWRGRKVGQPLAAADYEAVGGFAKCLSDHATAVYNKLPKEQQPIAETLFKAITEVTPDNRKVRRQSTAAAVCKKGGLTLDQIRPIVDAFSGGGTAFLVVSPTPVTLESIVDISHEALIRQWDTLKQWVEEEAASRRAMDVLETDAEAWKKLEDAKSDPKVLQSDRGAIETGDYLYVGSRLRDAEKLRECPDFATTPATVRFLKAGRDAENRRNRNRSLLLGGYVIVGLLIIFYGAYSYYKIKVAQFRTAEKAAVDAQDSAMLQRQQAQEAVERERKRQADLVEKLCGKQALRSGNAVCGELRQETLRPQPAASKRVYMQIGSEAQRAPADTCGKALGKAYAVQGVEKVARVPDMTSIRYFHPDDNGQATAIVSALKDRCKVTDAKATLIKGFDKVPLGQFEVWFSPTAWPPRADEKYPAKAQ